MNPTFRLACDLIAQASVTPDDRQCQQIIRSLLAAAGFECETIRSGEVTNLWARHGTRGPLLVFAGHTDVVPSGPVEKWTSDPFTPTVRDGRLYGRGAADMKTSVAAMVIAALAAHGESEISCVQYIERGYEDIVEKLRRLGADIRAVEEPGDSGELEAHIG